MQRMWALGVIAAMAILVGCQMPHPKRGQSEASPPMPPVPQTNLMRIRESFKRIDPQSQVGPVIAVLHSDRLAAVGDVPIKAFTLGETVMFIDADQNPIVSGTVVNVTADAVHVRYDWPAADRREPAVGDFAVKVK